MIRATDSSLVDEWQALLDPAAVDAEAAAREAPAAGRTDTEHDITAHLRAFRALVRTRAFRWVQLAAAGAWDRLADDLADAGDQRWTAERLAEAFAAYFTEHEAIVVDADARGPALFQVDDARRVWRVRQVLLDPQGHREWFLDIAVDLVASAEAGEIRATLDDVRRL